MASKQQKFSIPQNGAVDLGSVETNVTVWSPTLPMAFDNACNATWFTRIGTRHSQPELEAAFDATPDVDQTFCLSVNNVILIFSASRDENTEHTTKVLEMLQDRSMRANARDCVWYAGKSTDAGVRLDRIGNHNTFMVINEGTQQRT